MITDGHECCTLDQEGEAAASGAHAYHPDTLTSILSTECACAQKLTTKPITMMCSSFY